MKSATGKKFEVTNLTPPYKPAEQPEPEFELARDLSSDYQEDESSTHKLYLTMNAMNQITEHVGWGHRTEDNLVEQGGVLLGEVFTDTAEDTVYGIVEVAIPGHSARGTSGYLEMGHDTWGEMLNLVEDTLSRNPEKKWQIIGWYHTHPNNLAVFMSGTDQATQSRLFAHHWQFAMVLNPHHRRWRAFFGSEARECCGHVIENDKSSPSGNLDMELAELNVDKPEDNNEPPAALAAVEESDLLTVKSPRLLWICFFLLVTILILNLWLVITRGT